MAEPILTVDNLSVTFPQPAGDVQAVRGVSYRVNKGEFLGIVGESGSGKSVSSLAVMGLLPSNARIEGSIRYRDHDLLAMNDRQLSRLRGREISMIFQDPLSALTPVFTVGQQIEEALHLHNPGMSKQALRTRAVELLKVVGIPDPARRAQNFPHQFSGGMRQRAMIAIAIANDPDLIIADEPTTALDVTIQAQVLEVLQKAKELTGAAVVLITHDLGVVAGNVDQVAVMYAGKLVETAPVDDLFLTPRMPYTLGLMRSVPNMLTANTHRLAPLEGRPPSLVNLPAGCPFQPRCPIAVDDCRTAEPELVETGEGARRSACHRSAELVSGKLSGPDVFPRPDPLPSDQIKETPETNVIEVRDLIRHFPLTTGAVFKRRVGTVRAVDGISFDVPAGQTLGLVGESGCGKSTTILELMEMVTPQGGSITINGVDVSTLDRRTRLALRRDIQIVFQDPMAAVDPRLPVGDLIGEPLTVHKVPAAEREARVAEVMDLVGIDPSAINRYPHEFSGGQRQRIGIARALTTNPKILVLDEPVSALDVSIQAGVINLLEDLRDQLGLSYIFVAHDLAVVRQIADQIAVMYLGQIVEHGPVEAVYTDPRHPYTRALMSAVPVPDPTIERSRTRILLEGDLPSPAEEHSGCNFRGRCPLYKVLGASEQKRCTDDEPSLLRPDGSRVSVACHHTDRTDRLELLAHGRGTAGAPTATPPTEERSQP